MEGVDGMKDIEIIDKIADVILAYRYKRKPKKAKRRRGKKADAKIKKEVERN